MRCEGLLFDMDGVLVDSRAVVERTWRRWATRHALDPEPILHIAHGRRTRESLRLVYPELAVDEEVAWLDAAELEDVGSVTALPGAAELLASLPEARWTIVTSAGRDLASLRLRSAGLPVPRMMVTSEDVPHGKPAPDGYRLAAERLGLEPGRAVVVEDAPPGLHAALAAGMPAIALTTTHRAEQLAGAAVIIPHLGSIRVAVGRTEMVLVFAPEPASGPAPGRER
jgi:mannitol-1-/sugar-/sorbitol-6-phosphatase